MIQKIIDLLYCNVEQGHRVFKSCNHFRVWQYSNRYCKALLVRFFVAIDCVVLVVLLVSQKALFSSYGASPGGSSGSGGGGGSGGAAPVSTSGKAGGSHGLQHLLDQCRNGLLQ